MSRYDIYRKNYVEEIEKLRKKYDIPVKYLHVEVTETSAIGGMELVSSVLKQLHEYGYIVEMDDFGSGYSSLNMLKSLPVDVLKIDMNFLGKSEDAHRADTIVKNIINLSLDLGIVALTEGVENRDQYDILADMGCKLFQGYYFSKPVPVDDFEDLVIVKR